MLGERRGGKRLTAACGVLLTAGLLFACGDQSGATEAEHLARAEAYHAEGRYAAAAIAYRNALQHNPSAETRARLAEALRSQGDYERAEHQLRRALDAGVDPARYAPILLTILLEDLDRPAAAAALSLPDGLDEGERAAWHAAQASAAFQAGDPEQGLASLQRAEAGGQSFAALEQARAWQALADADLSKAEAAARRSLEMDPGKATGWVLLGNIARYRGAPEDALAAYGEAMALRPERIPERFLYAVALAEAGRLDEAAEAAEGLLEAAPEHPGGPFVLGLVAYERQQLDTARSHFERAATLNPAFRPVMPYRAAVLLDQGDWAQAEHQLRRFGVSGPMTPMAHMLLGQIRLAEGQAAVAVSHFEPVVAMRPESVDAREWLGVSLLMLGDLERGMSELETVAEQDSSLRRADVMLGTAQLRLGMAGDALATAERARHKDPAASEGYSLGGTALLALGREEDALELLREGFRRVPGNLALGLTLAELEAHRGDREAAAIVLESVLDNTPAEPAVRHRRASLLIEVGAEEAALSEYEHLVEADAQDVIALNNLAWLIREDHPERALTLAERAAELAPRNARVLDTLGVVLERNHDLSGALSALEQAQELEPANPGILFNIARVHHGSGDSVEARRHLERLLNEHPEFTERGEAEALLQSLTAME